MTYYDSVFQMEKGHYKSISHARHKARGAFNSHGFSKRYVGNNMAVEDSQVSYGVTRVRETWKMPA